MTSTFSSDTVYLQLVLCTNIDNTLVNSLHGLLNGEIGGLDCHQSKEHVSIVYTCNTYFVMYWSM